jgi:hypothetical protein
VQLVAFETKFIDYKKEQPSSSSNTGSGKGKINNNGQGETNLRKNNNNIRNSSDHQAWKTMSPKVAATKRVRKLMTSLTGGVLITSLGAFTEPIIAALCPTEITQEHSWLNSHSGHHNAGTLQHLLCSQLPRS